MPVTCDPLPGFCKRAVTRVAFPYGFGVGIAWAIPRHPTMEQHLMFAFFTLIVSTLGVGLAAWRRSRQAGLVCVPSFWLRTGAAYLLASIALSLLRS